MLVDKVLWGLGQAWEKVKGKNTFAAVVLFCVPELIQLRLLHIGFLPTLDHSAKSFLRPLFTPTLGL